MYEKKYTLCSSDVDYNRELKISSMLRLFQDIAIEHSEVLGIGNNKVINNGLIWIASRITVEINRLPRMSESIIIETCPGKTMHSLFPRYIQFKDTDGNILLKSCTIWALVDYKTRTLINPDEYNIHIDDTATGDLGIIAQNVKKLAAENTDQRKVLYSDLDLNGHMNNTKYADILMDELNKDSIEKHNYTSFKIVFFKETKLNDIIDIEYTKSPTLINVFGLNQGQKVFAAELMYND